MSRRSPVATVVACCLLAVTASASAQTVRVRLIDEQSRDPLAGVLVSALEANNAIGPTVLASADGIAAVRVAGAGPHRLLIRRIGFAPVTTDPIAAPAEAGQILDILVASHRITLGAVHVVGAQSCSDQTPSPSAGAAQAWTEVRTALEASALTRDQRLVTTAALRFQRDLRIDGTVNYTDTTQRGRSGERPFFAPAPAVLERDGYFRHHDDGSEDFYAPDEAVLLSPGFARLHCVSEYPEVRHGSDGTEIALAFVPRDRATRPDIRGLIWIDSATSELRRVEFEYMRISLRAPADSIGGTVEFRHLASGAWIVSTWSLRMPRFRMVDRRNNYYVLDGYIQVGGSASVTRDVATPGPNVPRRIVGSVFDSLANGPLAGAHVHLADLGRDAVADSLGAFRFDSVGAGVHTLWADHPRLDALGLFSLGTSVDLTPQVVTSVTLAVPQFATIWRRVCSSAAPANPDDAILFGRVTTGTASIASYGTAIAASWVPAPATPSALPAQRRALRAQVDSSGNYSVCGVPAGSLLTLSIEDGERTSIPVQFRVGAEGVARRDLSLPSAAAADSLIADSARVALGSAADGATLTGAVRDSLGHPLRDARISISGVSGELRADAKGSFAARGVPTGAHVVIVNAYGLMHERRLVNFGSRDSADVSLVLAGGVASAPSRTLRVVSADGNPVAFANVNVEGGATQITNERGELTLGAGLLEALDVRIRRIGFTPWFGKLEFADTATVASVTLAHVAQALGAVKVTGQKNPSSPFVQGFYDRMLMRQKGLLSAVFITPEELDFRHSGQITDMLRGLNGVCLFAPDGKRPIIFASHFGSLNPNKGCPVCPMAIVIDGVQQYGDNILVDMILAAHDVMAIEVYARAGNMPIGLQVNDTKCGVVAFWTGSRR